MNNLTKDQVDAWAARLINIFKNGQSWEDTHETEQSYVRGIVEGLASDVSLVVNKAALLAAYNCGFDTGYKEAKNKAAGITVIEYKTSDSVDPPVGGPTAA